MNPIHAFIGGCIVIFPIVWVTSWFLGLGEWKLLANMHSPPPVLTNALQVIRFASLHIRGQGIRYQNSITYTLYPTGLYISIFWLFRAGHPSIFIPWNNIATLKKNHAVFNLGYYEIYLYKPVLSFTVSERVGEAILQSKLIDQDYQTS